MSSEQSKTTNSTDWLAGYHQALEDAAGEIYDNNAHHYDSEMRSYAKSFAERIRAMKDKGL